MGNQHFMPLVNHLSSIGKPPDQDRGTKDYPGKN
jgi:hypothetical protein